MLAENEESYGKKNPNVDTFKNQERQYLPGLPSEVEVIPCLNACRW